MCRHMAYLGPPASLRDLIIEPPYGLARQAWAPRRQRYGVMNADGFGVGWYADGDPLPARYRRSGPIWPGGQLNLMSSSPAVGGGGGTPRSRRPQPNVEFGLGLPSETACDFNQAAKSLIDSGE